MMKGKTIHKVLRLLLCISLPFIFHFSPFTLRAQDQHFSMLDLDPLLFNPAYSGFFDGTGRFGVVYRNQWASVSTPFQTVSATAEFALTRSSRNMNGLSAGLWLSADRAGTLDYGSTSASAIVSYFQGLGDGNHILSLALEAGVGQSGFSPDRMVADDATEAFVRTRALYPTLGAGAAWFWQLNESLYTKLGIAMRNINEPDISFTELSSDARLSRRLTVYARGEWRTASQWGVMPVLGFQHQRNFNELVYGCDVRWYIRESSPDFLAFSAGLLGRHGDAAAINLGVLWREWTFAFSYDANLSRLASASHTIGAFEVGVVYMIAKRSAKRSSLPCPIF